MSQISSEYRICARCVMDTSDPEITFCRQGVCNHCDSYLREIKGLFYQGERSDRELERLIEQVRLDGKHREHDCVIGVSGGTDSSYLAYQTKQWGLRPLAVHVDNGWNSLEAVRNLRTVCEELKIDYVSYVLNWEDFRDVQLAFLRSSIVEIEIPTDVALMTALHEVAAKHGVRYVLSGGNLANEGILPFSWFYYPKDSLLLKSIHQKFGIRKPVRYYTFDFWQEIYYKFFRRIRLLYPLNYVPYSKADAKKTLEELFRWEDYGRQHQESHFTKFVQGYVQPTKFGIDYRRCIYSTQICLGRMTRAEALELLKTPPYDAAKLTEELAYIAKKLAISIEELEEILRKPPCTHRDYPNQEKLLSLIYRLYRLIFATRRSNSGTGQQR